MEQHGVYDLIVIGGGINGVGIAADAQGRGLKVLLCEQHDLANGTSSRSSKLIHGGLRYLAQYHFHLVRESLSERKILRQIAPHLVRPLRFVIPLKHSHHPYWMIRLGLYYYDWMGHGKSFGRSQALQLDEMKALSYWDAQADDARLVIANAHRFYELGGTLLTRTACLSAKRQDGYWQVQLQNTQSKKFADVQAKALVNATGPWADQMIEQISPVQKRHQLRLVKGSHIIVKKWYPQDDAYLLQHPDGRVVFVIPYLDKYTLIGTTDVEFSGDPQTVKISDAEIDYLCDITDEYLGYRIERHEIVDSFAGVRSLVDNPSHLGANVSREYKLDLQSSAQGDLPLINVYGGKLTTYRLMAQKATNLLKKFFPYLGGNWTHSVPLPGGCLPQQSMQVFWNDCLGRYPWIPPFTLHRYATTYGTLIHRLLEDVTCLADLGICFGGDLYQTEVDYLVKHEWAQTADDILMRRTKCGLTFTPHQVQALTDYLAGTPIPNAESSSAKGIRTSRSLEDRL